MTKTSLNETSAPSPARPPIDLPLGQVVSTPGALDALALAGQSTTLLLNRHQHGDWGEVGPEDRVDNDLAAVDGDRILSAYVLTNGTRIWIITEADRSATTLLLPNEY